ncbi:AraC family transcriptional regulator [Sphingobacterium olei]|uniref:AraC family transcriptional regulator n=1 Tax=Sphingobacterium olei TaxID=2571155 RepID=A0A4U0NHJ3_9SPHI|nr:helix-turn-helix domain-containing protein [Sphingobacterium olei]TJZ53691.1 AraC family transcriptional regulator [Sphingobacterium olei]
MKKDSPYIIHSISELHSFFDLKKPTHPLVSVINLSEVTNRLSEEIQPIVYTFYTVFLKKNCNASIKYGQKYYDFNDGIMVFFAPNQMFTIESYSSSKAEGWMLVFHPDFIKNTFLSNKINGYGFFSYEISEALHTSDAEENIIGGLMQNLLLEIEKSIDHYTQDVVISHIDLLLNYCNRFHNRQFITRKASNNEILVKLENLLNTYFDNKLPEESGIPSVRYLSQQLNVSASYLSDMLRAYTGQNTQQHIHNKLIDKAKELLGTTSLSVAEIAYQLGFEHPQSFHKLFKSKTAISPLKFRQSMN